MIYQGTISSRSGSTAQVNIRELDSIVVSNVKIPRHIGLLEVGDSVVVGFTSTELTSGFVIGVI